MLSQHQEPEGIKRRKEEDSVSALTLIPIINISSNKRCFLYKIYAIIIIHIIFEIVRHNRLNETAESRTPEGNKTPTRCFSKS